MLCAACTSRRKERGRRRQKEGPRRGDADVKSQKRREIDGEGRRKTNNTEHKQPCGFAPQNHTPEVTAGQGRTHTRIWVLRGLEQQQEGKYHMTARLEVAAGLHVGKLMSQIS